MLVVWLSYFGNFKFSAFHSYIKMNRLKGKTVLISGVIFGLGKVIAKQFAGFGYNLILTGWRADRFDMLTSSLKSNFGISKSTGNFAIRVLDVCNNFANKYIESLIDFHLNNTGLQIGLIQFNPNTSKCGIQ